MLRKYESPTIENVGGDDIIYPQVLFLMIYAVAVAIAVAFFAAAVVELAVYYEDVKVKKPEKK